ncbi:hypothetical protein MRX96_014890 [Rhipicephalus microplus]
MPPCMTNSMSNEYGLVVVIVARCRGWIDGAAHASAVHRRGPPTMPFRARDGSATKLDSNQRSPHAGLCCFFCNYGSRTGHFRAENPPYRPPDGTACLFLPSSPMQWKR